MIHDRKLLILLILGFIISTILGTISHEFGHYIIAKCLGYNPKINYGHTLLIPSKQTKVMGNYDGMLFSLGGPLITMLIGTIGLSLLLILKKSYRIQQELDTTPWVLIFLSLFWLRPITNFLSWLFGYLVNGRFSTNLDEYNLAIYFNIPAWVVISITAIIGLIIILITIIRFVPNNQKVTFIKSGIIGGITGYILWFKVIGKIILP